MGGGSSTGKETGQLLNRHNVRVPYNAETNKAQRFQVLDTEILKYHASIFLRQLQ